MEPAELQSRRVWIGLLAVGFLVAAAGLFISDPQKMGVIASLVRVGVLLAAFWLAIPVLLAHPKILKRLPWYVLLVGVLLFGFVKYILLLIPALILLALLTMFAPTQRKP